MHVLLAALNWGLGHAARTVPLIRYILDQGHRVTLASDGEAAKLWREEFPSCHVHELPGYGVRYATGNLYLDLLLATPRLLAAVRGEQHWLRHFAAADPPDLIISDNRYGFHLEKVPSILLSHQLRLRGSATWADHMGQFLLDRWISRFTEIWVPDRKEDPSLSGFLSERGQGFPPIHRIGVLSRFHVVPGRTPTIDILAILSGPEPQRSIFERLVIHQLEGIEGNHVLVRGTRRKRETGSEAPNRIRIIDLLPAPGLQELLDNSRMLLARCGYSTLMDLETTGMPALLVPTPGQFEQEYLAERHAGLPHWIFQRQDALDVRAAWNTLQDQTKKPIVPNGGTPDFILRLEAYLGPCST